MPEFSHPRGTVLVIDDEERTRYVFRRILSRAGYHVVEAVNGSEGLRLARTGPDIIVSDVNLPDMLGYDLCRRLKSDPETAPIPVLQISASFTSDESKAQALQGGADSYLVQPVEATVLLAQVQALLRLRKAESLSSLSARQWQTTFDSLSDGLALVDEGGKVIRTNRTFLTKLGVLASDVEGHMLTEVFERLFGVSMKEHLDLHRGEPTEMVSGGQWYRVRYDEVQGNPDQPSGCILLLTDITEHKKLQETLKVSERLAATGRLAHIIAHEINNPLEALANLLFLVENSRMLEPDARGYLAQATLELDRISHITRQILAYHRDSQIPLPASPEEVLQSVLAMFRSRMIANGVELSTRYRCTRTVRVHPGEVRQAVGNLLVNAMDAIPAGGGRMRVGCYNSTDLRTGRPGVRLVISDSGTGIEDSLLPQIFGAFFSTKDVRGSGIGLWLTSEAILKHEGRIRVRSRTSGAYRGTIFDVFLPEKNAPEPVEQKEQEVGSAQ